MRAIGRSNCASVRGVLTFGLPRRPDRGAWFRSPGERDVSRSGAWRAGCADPDVRRGEIDRWATAPAPRAHGGSRAAPRSRPRQHRLLFAQGVHPADAALPRHLPLLHLRARPARGRIRLSLARTRCWRSRAPARDAGCQEALFTLGDKPELKYEAARRALARLGHETTIDYLAAMCALVLRETGLLPHVNPGVMSEADIAALRRVSVSQGMMLESMSPRLCERGGPHHGSPDKAPAVRLATIEAAGRLKVPFTTGILIGIGETRAERIDSLLAIDATASPPRPHPGSHHPELPRQGRHRHGARAGAGRRRHAVDRRDGADRVRAGDEHPGAAQSQPGIDRAI